MNDPYEHLDESKIIRTTINLSGESSARLKSYHNRRGTLQVTVATLVEKFLSALTANGITTYDPERYELFLTDCAISVPGGTGVVPPTETNQSNDGRRTRRVASKTA